jgi:ABC-type phosphate transport system substrate-binding protein
LSIRRALQILFMIAASVSLAAARDLALISNKTNVFNGLTLADLVKVCKAQTNRWPDGKPITLVMRAPSTPEMKTFVEKVYAMPEVEINNLIVSANHGRANHPAIQVVASDEELLERVASTPGAIGVVDVYAINSSVSVIKLAGKLPLEPGYLLHGN